MISCSTGLSQTAHPNIFKTHCTYTYLENLTYFIYEQLAIKLPFSTCCILNTENLNESLTSQSTHFHDQTQLTCLLSKHRVLLNTQYSTVIQMGFQRLWYVHICCVTG